MATLEESCLEFYRKIKPETVKGIIPIIDFFRKIDGKPPIPLKERMCETKFPSLGDKVIMLHGVSVGEVMSLDKLIQKIKENFPDYKIVVTTGTVTGQQIAKKKYSEIVDFITYFPLDVYEVCRKFLARIKPSVVLIAETELWPNFAYCCRERGIPLYIINGRISDKSYKSYLSFKGFMRPIFKNYTGVLCQSDLDKQRFIELGSSLKNTITMKNLKFEVDKQECDISLVQGVSKIFIAASTHPGEEELALSAYKYLKGKILDLKLIIAPRHITRVPELRKYFKAEGYKIALRSRKETFKDANILLLDTLGELSKLYSICHVAFIGGSFSKKHSGGHNPIEAAVYNKPTVSGPSIKNFRDVYSILERSEASFVVKDHKAFYQTLEKLMCNDAYYNKIAQNCEKCFENQLGAADIVIEKLEEILDTEE